MIWEGWCPPSLLQKVGRERNHSKLRKLFNVYGQETMQRSEMCLLGCIITLQINTLLVKGNWTSSQLSVFWFTAMWDWSCQNGPWPLIVRKSSPHSTCFQVFYTRTVQTREFNLKCLPWNTSGKSYTTKNRSGWIFQMLTPKRSKSNPAMTLGLIQPNSLQISWVISSPL